MILSLKGELSLEAKPSIVLNLIEIFDDLDQFSDSSKSTIFHENLKGTTHDDFLLDFVKIIIYFLIKFIYLSLKGRLSLKGNSRYWEIEIMNLAEAKERLAKWNSFSEDQKSDKKTLRMENYWSDQLRKAHNAKDMPYKRYDGSSEGIVGSSPSTYSVEDKAKHLIYWLSLAEGR